MSAVELLTKAVQYDESGRKMEALKLYADGITGLDLLAKAEMNPEKKTYLKQKMSEYLDRAEHLKAYIQRCPNMGEVKDKIVIVEGATGYSYKTVFGKYLDNNVKEILIEEPYLRDFYQLINLVMFCELAVENCRNLKYIKVTTGQENSSGDQEKAFKSLQESLQLRNIEIYFEFLANMHDRQILLSNGYIIKIGRGLNYFKGAKNKFCLGAFNFNFRECKSTNIDILYSPELRR